MHYPHGVFGRDGPGVEVRFDGGDGERQAWINAVFRCQGADQTYDLLPRRRKCAQVGIEVELLVKGEERWRLGAGQARATEARAQAFERILRGVMTKLAGGGKQARGGKQWAFAASEGQLQAR